MPKQKRGYGELRGSIGPAEAPMEGPKEPTGPQVHRASQQYKPSYSTSHDVPTPDETPNLPAPKSVAEPKIKSTPTSIPTPPEPEEPSGGWSGPGNVSSIGNNGGIVLVLSVLLFCFTFWTPVVVPVWNTIWSGKQNTISQSQWQVTAGGFVFITIMTILGSLSGTSELALLLVLGLWAVFLIMNGTKQMGSVLDWFGGKTSGTTPKPAPNPVTPCLYGADASGKCNLPPVHVTPCAPGKSLVNNKCV